MKEDRAKFVASFLSMYLFSGLPSLVVLFGEFNKIFPDKKFDLVARMYVEKIVKTINSNQFNPGISLATGVCGLSFALQAVRYDNDNYENLQISFDNYILDACKKLIKGNFKFFHVFEESKYDIMFGLCGVLNYMSLFLRNLRVKDVVERFLSFFTNRIRSNGILGFSVKLIDSCLPQEHEEGSYINLGISHGIASILILLIKFYNQGIIVDFHKETINTIASWLVAQKKYDSNNFSFWPSAVYFGCEDDDYTRDAWCYGTPGVAYSLLLAGNLLGNKKMINDCNYRYDGFFNETEKYSVPNFLSRNGRTLFFVEEVLFLH